jgi:hypothetical protein
MRVYEQLLKTNLPEYSRVNHKTLADGEIAAFLGNTSKRVNFNHEQKFDFGGLKGRLMSSSYTPTPDNPEYKHLMAQLRSIFDQQAVDDRVIFTYETQVYTACFN